MLTKGDVLAYLGKASGPFGTYKKPESHFVETAKAEKKEEYKVTLTLCLSLIAYKVLQPLDGPAIRRLIVSTMLQSSIAARNPVPGLC